MLQQISIGKDFDPRNVELGALNGYIKSANQRFTQWFMDRKLFSLSFFATLRRY